ncbi:hypothetical protein N9X81_00130 [Schleiferiaceae bacterium]|nr:hypothetical protein [Schleiferiaceae bacterium]
MQYHSELAVDFLKEYFGELRNQSIVHAVLRNSEGLPKTNSSKDVDILFSKEDLFEAKQVALTIAYKLGYQCIWKNPLDYLFGMVIIKQVGNVVYTVKLDLFNGLMWRGFDYCATDKLLESRVDSEVFRLQPLDEAIVMLIYYSLFARTIKEKYRIKIKAAIHNESFEVRFRELTGLAWLDFTLDEYENWDELCENIRKRQIMKFLLSFKSYVRLIRSTYLETFVRFKLGTFISISGFDGCGKSTLINPLNALFSDLGISDKDIPDHFLSARIPAPHKLFHKVRVETEKEYTQPYSKGQTNIFMSVIRLTYYLFAFLVDRLLILTRMRYNTIVIYDRHIIDFLVDLSRFRIRSIPLYSSIFKRINGRRDIRLVVLADPRLSVERKNELSLKKAEELYVSYSQMTSHLREVQLFKNNLAINDAINSFNKLVFDQLEKRYKNV